MFRMTIYFFAFAMLLAAPVRAADATPNIVMIISDDHGWADYGFMNHPTIRTPHLDRLASQSLLYTRGYVPTSLCRPSLATLMTGLYAHQHRITGNDPLKPAGQGYLRALADPAYAATDAKLLSFIQNVPTLARLLGDKGYRSLQTGKWWEGKPASAGFTHAMTHGDRSRGGRHGDVGLRIGRDGMEPISEFIDEAVKDEKPFLLWYAPFLPHLPHNPPKRLLDKYTADGRSLAVAKYYAMVDWFDETCGQLLSHIDDRGIAQNTIVIYVSDNGWTQPDQIQNGAVGGPRGKRTPFDGGVRTPIMVRWPGKITPKRDDKTLVSSIDIVPTILQACGLKPTEQMKGMNLTAFDALADRNAVFGALYDHDLIDLDRPAASLHHRWGILGEWKLIVPTASAPDPTTISLFHITKDPDEKENLAAKYPDRVKELQHRIDGWWAAE